jgi:hypothetical protein
VEELNRALYLELGMIVMMLCSFDKNTLQTCEGAAFEDPGCPMVLTQALIQCATIDQAQCGTPKLNSVKRCWKHRSDGS